MRRRVAVAVLLLVLVALSGPGGTFAEQGDDDGPEGPAPSATELSFTEASNQTGFEYASVDNSVAGNGNDGVYVADYDRDLREDVLALGNNTAGPALFHNTGDGFERTGQLPDVAGRVQSALWLDHDGDGWEDLLLLPRDEPPVFLENDRGSFERTDVGLGDERFTNPVGASAADGDGDGRLELLVIESGRWSDGAPHGWNTPFLEGDTDNGEANAYFDWQDGEFVEDPDAGIGPDENGPHWSLATSFRDLTGDGHPDVHVANDYFNDTLYVNQGDGTFERRTLGASTDRNGMSSTLADVTGDGVPEVFVTNIFFPRDRISDLPEQEQKMFSRLLQRIGKRLHGNNFLVRQDDGSYADDAGEYGVAEGGWGWAAVFRDLDSDGEQDLFQASDDIIYFDDDREWARPMVWLQHGDQFYRQESSSIGLEVAMGRGAAGMDYQLDGAQDVLVGTYDQSYRIYRNDAPQGESLQVLVDGAGLDHTDVGTAVEATVDGDTQRRVSSSRADYQSQDTRVLHFGLGNASVVDELGVTWPDGTEQTLTDVDAGQRIRVTPDGIEERLAYAEG